MKDKPTHILVIRLSSMGDVAMTVPVVKALTDQHQEIKVTILTREFFAPIFRDISNVSVIVADLEGKHKGFFGLYKLAQELKELDINLVADLHNVLRTKILRIFLFSKKFVQIDKGRSDKKALISGQVFKPLKTTHQRYAEVFEKLGLTVSLEKAPTLKKRILNSKCTQLFGSNKKLIGIAPFAAYESKSYPLKKMETIIEQLDLDYTVVLFGSGNEEAKRLEVWSLKFTNVINLAGKVSLEEELDVISNLDAMISMDSANGHLAAMYGISVITIWGVTHPFAGFQPFNQNLENSILVDREKYPRIPTSVYGNKFPESYKNAIGSIDPQLIIAKLRAVVNSD